MTRLPRHPHVIPCSPIGQQCHAEGPSCWELPGGSPSTRGDTDAAQRRPAPVAGAPRSLLRGAPHPRARAASVLSFFLFNHQKRPPPLADVSIGSHCPGQAPGDLRRSASLVPGHCQVCRAPGAGTRSAGSWQKEAQTPGGGGAFVRRLFPENVFCFPGKHIWCNRSCSVPRFPPGESAESTSSPGRNQRPRRVGR